MVRDDAAECTTVDDDEYDDMVTIMTDHSLCDRSEIRKADKRPFTNTVRGLVPQEVLQIFDRNMFCGLLHQVTLSSVCEWFPKCTDTYQSFASTDGY